MDFNISVTPVLDSLFNLTLYFKKHVDNNVMPNHIRCFMMDEQTMVIQFMYNSTALDFLITENSRSKSMAYVSYIEMQQEKHTLLLGFIRGLRSYYCKGTS